MRRLHLLPGRQATARPEPDLQRPEFAMPCRSKLEAQGEERALGGRRSLGAVVAIRFEIVRPSKTPLRGANNGRGRPLHSIRRSVRSSGFEFRNPQSEILSPDFLLLPTDTIPTQIALLRVRDVDT